MTFSALTLPDGAVYTVANGGNDPAEAQGETWDGEAVQGTLLKSVDERRFTLTMGYPADTPDVAVARDGHLDFASEAEVEKAAWAFIQAPQVGLFHEDGTEGAGRIVESYIYRGPDWDVDGQVVKSGDWLIGTVWDEPAWNLIKSGEIRGTSMQGRADRRTPTPADLARVVNGRRRAN